MICWSYVKWVSIINPKSLATGAGVMISPKKLGSCLREDFVTVATC